MRRHGPDAIAQLHQRAPLGATDMGAALGAALWVAHKRGQPPPGVMEDAFLGPEYDHLLEDFYTSITNKDIFRKKGLGAAATDSLYDYTPLKKQIERVITAELLAKIAAEHKKGRRHETLDPVGGG